MTRKNTNSNPDSQNSRKRSAEWPVFEQNLATALKSMQEDEFLVISQKRSNLFVQFAAHGEFGMRVETTSGAYLDKEEDHSARTHHALLALGWKLPTGSPTESTPADDPDGSPNYFVDFPVGTSPQQIAALSVRTLADLYEIPHPGNLEYDAFDNDETPISYKILKIQSVKKRRASPRSPAKRLLKAVIAATGLQDLEYDDVEDLCISYGDLGVIVALSEGMSFIRILSPMMKATGANNELLEVINTLNAEQQAIKYFVYNDYVMAMHIISAQPIVDQHVHKAIADFARHAMEASPKLAEVLLSTAENVSPTAHTLQ